MENTNTGNNKTVDERYKSAFATRLRGLTDRGKIICRGSKDLAEYLGVSPQQISNYRTGLNMPSLTVLCEIAKFYNVSVDFLLGLSDSRSTDNFVKEAHEKLGLTDDAILLMQSQIEQLLKAANTSSITEALEKQKKVRQFYLGNPVKDNEKIAFAQKLGLAEKDGHPLSILDSLIALVFTPACVTINILVDELDKALFSAGDRDSSVIEALQALFDLEEEPKTTQYAIIKFDMVNKTPGKVLTNEHQRAFVENSKMFNYFLLDLERALQEHRQKHTKDSDEE